jgi:hypothetical protein
MVRYAFVALCVLAISARSAEIFRWVDAEGHTHFSDRRPADAEVQRLVPEAGIRPDRPPDGAELAGDMPSLGPYRAFDILAPTAGAVLIQPIDTLDIHLQLDPPLLEGHRLDLMLDGLAVAVESGSTQLQMQGVGFQAHRVQARVRDARGTVVAATRSHGLELRRSTPPGVLP